MTARGFTGGGPRPGPDYADAGGYRTCSFPVALRADWCGQVVGGLRDLSSRSTAEGAEPWRRVADLPAAGARCLIAVGGVPSREIVMTYAGKVPDTDHALQASRQTGIPH